MGSPILATAAMHTFSTAAVLFLSATWADAQTMNPVQATQTVCEGDTRGDRRCNHDQTHRVCALIGDPDTSFWEHTGQNSWCGTIGYYGGEFGATFAAPSRSLLGASASGRLPAG